MSSVSVLPGEPAQQRQEVQEEGEPCYKAERAQGLPRMDEPEHFQIFWLVLFYTIL